MPTDDDLELSELPFDGYDIEIYTDFDHREIEPSQQGGLWYAHCPKLPRVYGWAATPQAALAAADARWRALTGRHLKVP